MGMEKGRGSLPISKGQAEWMRRGISDLGSFINPCGMGGQARQTKGRMGSLVLSRASVDI